MFKAVLDTNILVSALLSPAGAPARVFDHVLNGDVILCFDSKIILEYREVLARPKFNFDPGRIEVVLDFILKTGISIVPKPLSSYDFIDKDDQVFFEVAISTQGYLITGNLKHFPQSSNVVTAAEFLQLIKVQ